MTMTCTPYLVPSVRSKRTGCRLAVAQGEGIGAELLKEATKNCERCSASHKCEADLLWEHMDATLAEPSACQNDAEALQLLRTHQWGPSWLATQRFVSLARSMTERDIKKMRFKSNGNYPIALSSASPAEQLRVSDLQNGKYSYTAGNFRSPWENSGIISTQK